MGTLRAPINPTSKPVALSTGFFSACFDSKAFLHYSAGH